jgi:hypothetical protein
LEEQAKRLLCEKLFRESLFVKRLSCEKPHGELEQKTFLEGHAKSFSKNLFDIKVFWISCQKPHDESKAF